MFLYAGGKDKDVEFTDFLPGWWREQEEDEYTSQEELTAKANTLFAAFGGKPVGG